jgi:hypothetical protein
VAVPAPLAAEAGPPVGEGILQPPAEQLTGGLLEQRQGARVLFQEACEGARAVTGLEKPSISDEELERYYRVLVADDDARGVPKEFAIIAIEKRASLKEAYDKIIKERSNPVS